MPINGAGFPYCCEAMEKENWYLDYEDDKIVMQEDYSAHYIDNVLNCPWCGKDLWSMYEINFPASTQNRVFLQLFDRCKNTKHFSVGFYVSSTVKRYSVEKYIDFCLKHYKKIGEDPNIKMLKDPYGFRVDFLSNGSVIKFLVANDHTRGHRFNFAIIDKDIDKEARDCFIYPKLLPYMKNDGEYEDIEPNSIEFSI